MLEKVLIREIVEPLIIVLVFFLLYFIINLIIKSTIRKKLIKNDDKRKKTILLLINSIIKYFLMILAVMMILNVYGVDTSALITSLGLLGLGVSLALQDTLKDFIAGVFIIFENQYAVGDVVTIGSFKGEVKNLGLKTTQIKSYTGEVKIIANRNIQEVINHSYHNSLAMVKVDVSVDDDVDKVEKILSNLCKKLSGKISNVKSEINVIGVTELGKNNIQFGITAETLPNRNEEVERKLRKEIKKELDKSKIDIPVDKVVVSHD